MNRCESDDDTSSITSSSTLSLYISAYDDGTCDDDSVLKAMWDAQCLIHDEAFEFPRQQKEEDDETKMEVSKSKPAQKLIDPVQSKPAAKSVVSQATSTTTTDEKIDIIAENQPLDKPQENNFATPNPGTHSTYQRVEKGTRTALLYWDGWLSAQDARLAEDDPNYFGKSTTPEAAAPKEAPKRNTNLKKNWTYGKNGEIIYIATGFVGALDKEKVGGTPSAYSTSSAGNVGSSYGNLGNQSYAGNRALPKPTGPSVATIWDAQGNPQNRSAYANVVTSSRGNLGASSADYFGKSNDGKLGTKSDASSVKKNWAYGKNGEILYIPTGFVGIFDKDKVGAGGNRSTYSAVGSASGYGAQPSTSSNGTRPNAASTSGASGNTGSSYGNLGNQSYGGYRANTPKQSGPSVATIWDAQGNPQNRSAYANVVTSSRGNLGAGGSGKTNDDYFGKSNDGKGGAKGATSLKKNWAYGKNGEIIYIATGFVGIFDKDKIGAGGNRSTYSAVGSTSGHGAQGPQSGVAGGHGVHPSSSGHGTQIPHSPSGVGGHGAQSSGAAGHGVHPSSAGYGAVHSPSAGGHGTQSGIAGGHGVHPSSGVAGHNAQIPHSPSAVGAHVGGSQSPHSPSGGRVGGASGNVGSSYGLLGNQSYAGNRALPKPTGPSVATIWDAQGNPQNRSAYANVVTSSRGNLGAKGGVGAAGGGAKNHEDDDYFGKSNDGKGGAKGATSLKKNWAYGKNGEIIYIATGFVGSFDKPAGTRPTVASACTSPGGAGSGTASSPGGRCASPKPSIGTAWDLHGNIHNRSVYANLKK